MKTSRFALCKSCNSCNSPICFQQRLTRLARVAQVILAKLLRDSAVERLAPGENGLGVC